MAHQDLAKTRATRKAWRIKNATKIREQTRAYALANPDVVHKAEKKWRDNHVEDYADTRRNWRKANPEKVRERKRVWCEKNPEKVREQAERNRKKNHTGILASNARRRALQAHAPLNDFTAAQWQAMKEHYGHRCVYCGRKMQRLSQDHITPLSKGGSHTFSNIVPACQSCNSRKHAGPVLSPVQPLLLICEGTRHDAP